MSGRGVERLDYAERWLLDGLRVLRPPFSVLQISADMTNALRRLESLRQAGHIVTTTHLLIYATARSFAANRSFHQLIAGNKRYRPARIDIGVSVQGQTFVAPVLIIEGADAKELTEIADEVQRRVPDVREADKRMIQAMRRWGWLVPIGFLRRAVLRLLFRSGTFRTRGAGSFLVSVVSGESGLTSTFATGGVLMAGLVVRRAVPIDEQVVIRPMMTLTLSGDHGVWDGRAAARFLAAVKQQLESSGQSDAVR
jgi:pyruvate/2-oxoglutarate dehydrogenase complex dihydrolipoamide acyltransferase (E2) component